MQITPIGSRGYLFSYPELEITNVYLILAEQNTFLCDTFLGPAAMVPIKQFLERKARTQPIIIFNSHKDWDHVWGNCAFADSMILASQQCRDNLEKNFEEEWRAFGTQALGDVQLVLPNLAFTGRVSFHQDQVLFFSSPGHTNGSTSCWDLRDKVLFVGDNVEHPLPYLYAADLKSYAATLESYLDLPLAQIITGHGALERMTRTLVRRNLDYINALAEGLQPKEDDWTSAAHKVHAQNLAQLETLKRENLPSTLID